MLMITINTESWRNDSICGNVDCNKPLLFPMMLRMSMSDGKEEMFYLCPQCEAAFRKELQVSKDVIVLRDDDKPLK